MLYTGQDVSIVICAYSEERWSDLAAAIQSVENQLEVPREIIVVIDHNPGLLEQVRRRFPAVVALANKQDRGASGARNTGVASAKGSIIAFLDDDATAEREWLTYILNGHRDSNVLGVGGWLEPSWAGVEPGWFPAEFKWVVGCTYRGLPQQSGPIRNLIAANMSVRRDAFVALGGFRSGFGKIGKRLGCEETELCIRALQQWPGKIWLYDPRARVHHKVPSTRSTWKYFRSRCYDEGLVKALVSKFVGSNAALASERTYVVRTLPSGIIINLVQVLQKRDMDAFLRAGAIIVGLIFTSSGYVKARLSSRLQAFAPGHRQSGSRREDNIKIT